MSSERDSREFAIRVRNVSKHYAMFERPEDRFKQMVVPRMERLMGRQPRRYYRDFAALNDVSFEVGHGQTLGIIGRNGSGKSTLLQIICGTLPPTSGTVEVNGRIAALLELGAGFNREFTGRENVHLNASILGVPREEMEWRFEQIEKFADIGDFIDQPVKTYSSGMYMRLAFATAINVDPDILVVDEALGVGDEAFQRKCMARIEQIKDNGATILFTSHGAQTIIQLCTSAILIDAGEKILEGTPKQVASQYQRLVNLKGEQAAAVREEIRRITFEPEGAQASRDNADSVDEAETEVPLEESPDGYDPHFVSQSRVEYEPQGAKIECPRLLNLRGQQVNQLHNGREYRYCYEVYFEEEALGVGFGMLVKTVSGLVIAGAGTGLSSLSRIREVERGAQYQIEYRFVCNLLPGTYLLNAGVSGTVGSHSGFLHRVLDAVIFKVGPKLESIATGIVDIGAVATLQRIDSTRPTSQRVRPSRVS